MSDTGSSTGSTVSPSARSWGVPIYYVVCDQEATKAMILLNQNMRSWRQEEFLRFHAETKGGCYKDLYDFDKNNNIGISNAIAIYPERQINATTIRLGELTFRKKPERREDRGFSQK